MILLKYFYRRQKDRSPKLREACSDIFSLEAKPRRFYIKICIGVTICLSLLLLSVCLQKAYIRKEREASEQFWVTSYMRWHYHNRNTARRRIVFRPVRLGLGDNFRGVLRAYAFAVLTNRVFLIDWNTPFPLSIILSNHSRTRFIYRPRNDAPREEKGEQFMAFHFKEGREREHDMFQALKGSVHTVFIATARTCSTGDISNMGKALSGEHKIPIYSDSIKQKILHTIMQPSKKLLDRQTKINRRYGFCIPSKYKKDKCMDTHSKPYISVHARIGRGVGEDKNRRFYKLKGRDEHISRCLVQHVKNTIKHMQSRDLKVFIASDTPEFRTVFRKVMERLMPNNNVYYTEDEVRHYDEVVRRSGWAKSLKEKNEMFMNVFLTTHLEMRLIGHGAHIISLKSGFSHSSYWLGESSTYRIIDPESCAILPET